MYSYGPPLMAEQKQDVLLEHTFSNYVRIRDLVLKTCRRRWTIGKSGERGSGISVQAARHDDDDIYIYIYIYISEWRKNYKYYDFYFQICRPVSTTLTRHFSSSNVFEFILRFVCHIIKHQTNYLIQENHLEANYSILIRWFFSSFLLQFWIVLNFEWRKSFRSRMF